MRVLLALLFLLPLVPATLASYGPCDGRNLSLGIIQVTSGSATSTVYVDDRNYVTGNGLWFFAESNGIWSGHAAGVYLRDALHVDLQRGDHSLIEPSVSPQDELCIDDVYVQSDLLIL